MPEKRIAQYKQIENDLLQKINLGYYKKDDLIPTEFELSDCPESHRQPRCQRTFKACGRRRNLCLSLFCHPEPQYHPGLF